MINRPAGLIDAAPPLPYPAPARGEGKRVGGGDGAAPCQGCRHLFVRHADGGPGRPCCAQGVEYGQPGCPRRAPRLDRPHG